MNQYTDHHQSWTLKRVAVGALIAVASALLWIVNLWPLIVMIIALSGCAGGHDRPPVLINGYDPALRSHQEALSQ